ncbi:hypothetical protein HDF18_08085 [Mucilaginibacter sp. X5P1]|uniref:hypothetical protein n=1 Tax=Mucilaginibacter sp. X5P1 TaxID=2723088 RepID=UPI00162089B4|nr:hypothetical protein [Mucilaginibacter sp. X5P1]MBB6137613.1 hypothetical protein [Mucilaginibacter sp. X5P1]
MKKTIAALLFWQVFACHAQTIDTANQLAASYFKETELATRNQHIWNEKLYGRMLFVEPYSRVAYANMPDSAGILKPDGDIYKGILPNDVLIANTSVYWEGKLWSFILWPLPTDRDERVNMMVHESFHRIQEKIGFPQNDRIVDHLSTMYGRIYFLLELQALKAALSKPVKQRGPDLTNALIFREKRRELFPNTFKNERLLEMNEGVAEYTGVILGRPKDSIRQHLYHVIDTAGNRKSFIRLAAYMTGPVYGYLLYEKDPQWTLKADSNSDFPVLISKYYHVNWPNLPTKAALAALEKKYNGDVIIQSEKLKEDKRLQVVKRYTVLFTQKPTLTISLIKVRVNFNPSTLFDMGEYGTLYPTAVVKDVWGELIVSANGMLMKDWKIVTLPISEGLSINNNVITDKGWKIILKDNCKIVKVDSLHYKLSSQ